MQPSHGAIFISEILSSSVFAPLSFAPASASCNRVSVFPPFLGLQTIPITFMFELPFVVHTLSSFSYEFCFYLPFW